MRKRLLAIVPLRMSVLLFVILNIFELCVLFLSLTIYTSPFKSSPWYEPDTLAFLGVLLISPLYLLVGTALFILSKFLIISKMNKLLPFIAFIVLVIPVFLLDTFQHEFYQIVTIGILACCLLFCGVIITTIKDLILVRKNKFES
jgi:hypothetical protein